MDNQSMLIVSFLIASELIQNGIGIDSLVYVLASNCEGVLIVGI